MKGCLIIDGMYMVCKTYQGPMRFFTNSKKELTGAIYGFLRSLIALKKKEEFQYSDIVVAWDRPPEHKYNILPEYKSGRVKHSEDKGLMKQIKSIEVILTSLGVIQVYCDKQEADDVVASFIKKSEYDYYVIYSTDMDYLQLVTDNVVVLSTKSNGDVVSYDISAVESQFNVSIDKVSLYRAFRGDKSDGLPGVKYVKDKILCELVQKCTTIDDMEGLLDLKIKSHLKIKDFLDSARKNLEIAELQEDLNYTVVDGVLNFECFEEKLQQCEFKSILKSLDKIKGLFVSNQGFLK